VDIVTPIIGIPNYSWKKEAVKIAIKKPNEIKCRLERDMAYDCHRHYEFLKLLDKGESDYTKTEYYLYQKEIRTKDSIKYKIRRFKRLYDDIKNNGYDCSKCPIITIDGCRLDGSHRIAILIHLEYKYININVFDYVSHFGKKKTKKILEQNKKYRNREYNL